MSRIFSKTFLRTLPRTGMRFVNALMLASILLSNITGVVQARAESGDVSGTAEQESSIVPNDSYDSKLKEYVPPVFEHPEASG
jgi:hypothetical protein